MNYFPFSLTMRRKKLTRNDYLCKYLFITPKQKMPLMPCITMAMLMYVTILLKKQMRFPLFSHRVNYFFFVCSFAVHFIRFTFFSFCECVWNSLKFHAFIFMMERIWKAFHHFMRPCQNRKCKLYEFEANGGQSDHNNANKHWPRKSEPGIAPTFICALYLTSAR